VELLYKIVGLIYELTKYKSESDVGTDDLMNKTSFFDAVCSCTKCNHGLVRDCLKVSCVCCKGSSHSMVLDGIEGFPPTTDNKGLGH
jgi:hypothetical protein